jgi:hypothetical protein
VEYELPGSGAGIDSDVEDAEPYFFSLQARDDFEQVRDRSSKTVEAQDYEQVTLSNVIKSRGELISLADARDLFAKDLLASSSLQLS